MCRISIAGLIVLPLTFVVWSLSAAAAAADSHSVWDGVYSKAQAARGKTTFGEECARCHGDNLMGGEGGSPELVGDTFVQRWSGKTVGDLFEIARTTMPTDSPGSLNRQQYADIIAYILSANSFPAGAKDMPSDTAPLKEVQITAKK
jgi:S-disulfanyl-L-cysteine oxidoreductase SoxD